MAYIVPFVDFSLMFDGISFIMCSSKIREVHVQNRFILLSEWPSYKGASLVGIHAHLRGFESSSRQAYYQCYLVIIHRPLICRRANSQLGSAETTLNGGKPILSAQVMPRFITKYKKEETLYEKYQCILVCIFCLHSTLK